MLSIKSMLGKLRAEYPLNSPNKDDNSDSANYDCFILGSGRSLLNIGPDEVRYINRSPFVLTFNKYLIFYKMIGIIPTHFLLGDSGEKALLMFRETLAICEQDPLTQVKFIFSKALKRAVEKQPGHEAFVNRNIEKRMSLISRSNWLKGGKWAQSLKDPIYHYRGSLSGAINIASILNPNQRIKLLGVDLNTHQYFFRSVNFN